MKRLAQCQKVLFKEHSPFLAEIQLKKPKALNSLDLEMIDSMQFMLDNLQERKRYPSAVLFTGSGTRAFCAGADILSIYKSEKGDSIRKDFYKKLFKVSGAFAKLNEIST